MILLLTPFVSAEKERDAGSMDLRELLMPEGTDRQNLHPHPSLPNIYVESVIDPRQTNPRLKVVKENLFIRGGDETGRRMIPVENVSANELMAAMRQDTNLARSFVGTLKNYPMEYGKFNAAMIALEIVNCYGGSAFSEMTLKTSASSPLCVDHLIKALTTLEGNVGFFAFIYGNRIASAHLTNLATVTSLAINKPLTPERIAAIRPMLGYVGMSFGMAAQQVVSHILTIPTFKECSKDMARGNFRSAFCIEAAKHFISADKFWMDFGAGLPSLIGGAMMSSGSHWLIKNAKFIYAPETLKASKGGISSAFKTMKTLRMTKNLVSVGSGPPGVFIAVGEVVIFLVWTKLLEIPTMQWVWSAYDAPDIKRNTQLLLKTADDIEKSNGAPETTVDVSCKTIRTPRGVVKQKCNSIEFLSQALKDLHFYSRRYREKVTLIRLNRSVPDWLMKWDKYIASYFTGKVLLQEIYSQKAKIPNMMSLSSQATRLLSLYDTGFTVSHLWRSYLMTEDTSGNIYSNPMVRDNSPTEVKMLVEKIEKSFADLKAAYTNQDSRTAEFEKQLAKELVDLKKVVDRDFPYDPALPCGGVTRGGGFGKGFHFCRAVKSLRLVPAKADDFFNQPREANLYSNVALLQQLNQSLPVEDTLKQFLCGKSTELKSKAGFGSGLPAKLELPRIIQKVENDSFFRESCRTALNNKEFLPTPINIEADGTLFDVDPAALWVTNTSFYLEPLSLLADSQFSLSPGLNERSASDWWNKQMIPEAMTFYVNYLTQFKEMLDQNLFKFILTDASAQGLLDADVFIDDKNSLSKKVAQKQSLNLSLIGQMQILGSALEKVSSAGLRASEKNQLKESIHLFLLNFAEHTRHIKYQNDPSTLNTLLTEGIGKVIAQPLQADPTLFVKDVTKHLFAGEMEKKTSRQRALQLELAALGESILGPNPNPNNQATETNIDKIANIEEALKFSAVEVAKMTPAEYRKYTVLQIIQHMSLVIDETSGYYDNYLFLAGLFNFYTK